MQLDCDKNELSWFFLPAGWTKAIRITSVIEPDQYWHFVIVLCEGDWSGYWVIEEDFDVLGKSRVYKTETIDT